MDDEANMNYITL